VQLVIHDAIGRVVRTLIDEALDAVRTPSSGMPATMPANSCRADCTCTSSAPDPGSWCARCCSRVDALSTVHRGRIPFGNPAAVVVLWCEQAETTQLRVSPTVEGLRGCGRRFRRQSLFFACHANARHR
jgi:hypothetical protein